MHRFTVISVLDTNVHVNRKGQGKSRDRLLVRNQGCATQHATAVTVADFYDLRLWAPVHKALHWWNASPKEDRHGCPRKATQMSVPPLTADVAQPSGWSTGCISVSCGGIAARRQRAGSSKRREEAITSAEVLSSVMLCAMSVTFPI